MSTTSQITASGNPTQLSNDVLAAATRAHKTSLGVDDFLKLLTVQLQHQDPMKPMEDAEFMGQMAQFAALEQTKELATSFSEFTKLQNLNSVQQFLGKTVTVDKGDGSTDQGTVSEVSLIGTDPQIYLNGAKYNMSSVVSVSLK
jgi:flagellar basal-body rod modification protein FlgD